jgi:hypothetical protein
MWRCQESNAFHWLGGSFSLKPLAPKPLQAIGTIRIAKAIARTSLAWAIGWSRERELFRRRRALLRSYTLVEVRQYFRVIPLRSQRGMNPDFIVVPAYDPLVVFAPPPPGFFVGGAIAFGFGVRLGAWFRPWGWGECRIGWGEHAIFINNVRWERGWRNRAVYVHDYPRIHRWVRADRIEHHELFRRSAAERAAARGGFAFHEAHHHR